MHPAVAIILPLESPAEVVYCDLGPGDRERLHAWLEEQPELADLVVRALELAEKARAA
jgi:hypothetical protein